MLALKVKGGVGEVHLEFHCRTLQNCDNFGFMEKKNCGWTYVYGVETCVYCNPKILVSAPVPLALKYWDLFGQD